jgi:hypothetical protein
VVRSAVGDLGRTIGHATGFQKGRASSSIAARVDPSPVFGANTAMPSVEPIMTAMFDPSR